MKLSTKGRYGLRAMLDLAINSRGDQVSLNSISERIGVSTNYLEQVFSALRKAGLVTSVKGAQGGYILSASPSNITVGNILRALEGELSVVDESEASDNQDDYLIRSVISGVWEKINESIKNVVDKLTLEDLVTESRKLTDSNSFMFYI